MSSMGVTVGTEGGRPAVRGVVLDDSGAEVGEIQHFSDLRNDVQTQVHELTEAIEAALRANSPQVMVIRLGRVRIWERRRTVAMRARAEGVLVATCRDRGVQVLLMDGDQVAGAIGTEWDAAKKAMKERASKEFFQSGQAALAAHAIARRGGPTSS